MANDVGETYQRAGFDGAYRLGERSRHVPVVFTTIGRVTVRW
jgi:hypothetical protein